VHLEDAATQAGEEVSFLVKNAVIRQLNLMVYPQESRVTQQGRRIVNLPVLGMSKTYENGYPMAMGHQALQRVPIVVKKSPFDEQIFRRIATKRQLGEGHDVRAGALGSADPTNDLIEISTEVTYSGVYLILCYS